MKKYVFCFIASFFVLSALSAKKQAKPLYKMQEKSKAVEELAPAGESKVFLVGTSKGLFKVSGGDSFFPIWAEGSVEQIVRTVIPGEDGKLIENWYFRTSKGILFSSDLEIFE